MDRILDINNYFKEHYKDSLLVLPKLSKDLGISSRKISDLIKNEYNHSFNDHLNHFRLQEAKRLLTLTELKIFDIALEVGYDNHEYFTRVFKQTLGLTPSQFREKNKSVLN
jgi:two-component system, response regulator YesN